MNTLTLTQANDTMTTPTPIQVLYAPPHTLIPQEDLTPYEGATPVVRYSDHCAAVQALQAQVKDLETRLARREEYAQLSERVITAALQQLDLAHEKKELAFMHSARAILKDRLSPVSPLTTYHENKPMDEFIGRIAQGRWDDKTKLPGAL